MIKRVNTYLVVGIMLLLTTTAYLFGKVQTMSKTGVPSQSSEVRSVSTEVTPTPTGTPKATTTVKKVLTTPTPTPERKKVSIYIDDFGGYTKGTFYCYEDKVNELTRIQNDLRIADASTEGCWLKENATLTSCNSKCGGLIDCYNGCIAEMEKICGTKPADLRKELATKVRQYCP